MWTRWRMALRTAIVISLAAAGCGPSLPSCEGGTAQGNVWIDSDEVLKAMTGCMEITGDLTIRARTITSLTGLESLARVDGGVQIDTNPALADVSALAHLAWIGGLGIGPGNTMLADIGFPGLARLDGSLSIEGEGGAVASLAFPLLTSIGGNVRISGTTSLTTLAGLQGVTSIGGSLDIQNNAALVDTIGLSALTEVPTDLLVSQNPALTSLTLPVLGSVGAATSGPMMGPSGRQLYVSLNTAMTTIILPSLNFVGPGGVRISNNIVLPQCQADLVATRVGQTCMCINNNGPGTCN